MVVATTSAEEEETNLLPVMTPLPLKRQLLAKEFVSQRDAPNVDVAVVAVLVSSAVKAGVVAGVEALVGTAQIVIRSLARLILKSASTLDGVPRRAAPSLLLRNLVQPTLRMTPRMVPRSLTNGVHPLTNGPNPPRMNGLLLLPRAERLPRRARRSPSVAQGRRRKRIIP